MIEDPPAFTEEWGDLSLLGPLAVIRLAMLARCEGVPVEHDARYLYNFSYKGRSLQFNDSMTRDEMMAALVVDCSVLPFPKGGRDGGRVP